MSMLGPDHVNAIFEGLGAWFTWRNAWQLWRDKSIRGVYWPAWFFFAAWGLWNLFYYPSLNQFWSFAAGIVLVGGNVVWCALALVYRKNNADLILQDVGIFDAQGDLIHSLSQQAVNLKDEGVRKALIELGWAPPQEKENA